MENKDEIRLKTVRHLDPHVVHIVDSASRTALYSYEQDTESWSKPEVEGTLMIYSREAPPHNMIILINRLNKTNFIEPLTSNCDIQVNPPFLLFRNNKGVIYGIWFSANDHVHRISTAIRQKINQNSQPIPHPASNIINPPAVGGLTMGGATGGGGGGSSNGGGGGGDIMSMLSRAHGVYESKRQEPTCIVTTTSTSSSDLVKPSPLRVGESNNTNVADFFAKVGMSSMGASGATLPSPSSVSGVSTSTTNPVLQKLFQGAAAVGGQARVAVSAGSAPIPISGTSMQSHSTSISSSVPPPSAPMSLQELEGKLKENLHIAQNKDDQNVSKSHTQGVSSLLSPQVFTRTNLQDRDLVTIGEPTPSPNASYPNIFTPLPNLGLDVKPLNGSRESLQDGLSTQLHSNITPLTHEQLVQAFSILLKKNDFVQQLHEAYIQALNQSLKGCL